MLYPIYIWASLKTRYTPQNCMFIAAITDDNFRFSPMFQTNPNLICHYLRWFSYWWFSYYRLYSFTPMFGGWGKHSKVTQCGDLHIMTLSDGPSGRVICRGFHFWCSSSGVFLRTSTTMIHCVYLWLLNWDIILGDLLAVVFVIVSLFHQKR